MINIELELRGLEESLWQPLTRFDATYMDGILAPGFTEIGRSGTMYTREEILSIQPAEFNARLPLPEFVVRMVTDEVAIVTYRSEVRHGDTLQLAHRCSIWQRGPAGWHLEFHQGTAVFA